MIRAEPIHVVVRDVFAVTPLIRQFTLARPDGALLPAFSGGSHVVVTLRDGTRVYRNPYSLAGAPDDRTAYRIAVRRLEQSRGGSHFLHDRVTVGTTLEITPPVNLFALDRLARCHILIAGGVGITPFLAQIHELRRLAVPFELHYAVRGPEHAGLARIAETVTPGCVTLYAESEGRTIDPFVVLADRPIGTHVYVCGPGGMIDGVIAAARACGWTDSHIHFERFTAPPPGDAFKVFLRRSGLELTVPPDMSLLEAMEAAGVDAPYLCRGGACGQCETDVLSLDGTLVHNDTFLSESEKTSGTKIMPCVSRAVCRSLVLDR